MRISLRSLLPLCLALLLCACSSVATQDSVFYSQPFETGTFQAHLGVRALADDAIWEPADEQTYLGVSWSGNDGEAPFVWDVGLFYSEGDGARLLGAEIVDANGSLLELSIGALKTYERWRVRPYFGAGVSLLRAEADVVFAGEQIEDGATTFGVYARAGLLIPFRGGEVIGLDVRRLVSADIDLGPLSGDADATVVAFTFGYSF